MTRRFAAWLACFAILFAAVAPSISHALSMSRGERWAEICSVAGPKFVKVAADQDTPSAPVTKKNLHLEHCPFCATHGGPFVMLPGARAAIALLDKQVSHPFLFFQSPGPLPVWTTAQSRAPPAQA